MNDSDELQLEQDECATVRGPEKRSLVRDENGFSDVGLIISGVIGTVIVALFLADTDVAAALDSKTKLILGFMPVSMAALGIAQMWRHKSGRATRGR